MTETDEPVGGSDVCAAAGISYRQLDYWSRVGVLRELPRPGGSGWPRLYDPGEVDVACCVARLMSAGLTLTAAGYVARKGPPAAGSTTHPLAAGAVLVLTADAWQPVPRVPAQKEAPQ